MLLCILAVNLGRKTRFRFFAKISLFSAKNAANKL